MADLLRETAELGSPLLALQRALLVGAADSQRREASRLAAIGREKPRAEEVNERAEALSTLAKEGEELLLRAQHIAATATERGLFHGYVQRPDGAPANGYTVKLLLGGRKELSSTVDVNGYFSIRLDSATQTVAKGPVTATVLGPDNRTVLTDPIPLNFENGRSELRFYGLGMEGSGRGSRWVDFLMRAFRR